MRLFLENEVMTMTTQLEKQLQNALDAVARAQKSYDDAVKERRELVELVDKERRQLERKRQELRGRLASEVSNPTLFEDPIEDLQRVYETLLAEYESKHDRLLKVMPGMVKCAETELRSAREKFGELVYTVTGGGRSLLRALNMESACV